MKRAFALPGREWRRARVPMTTQLTTLLSALLLLWLGPLLGCAVPVGPGSEPAPPSGREVSVGTARERLAPVPPSSSATVGSPMVPAGSHSRATGSVVVVARDVSPRDPAWYQINVMLVDNANRIVAPDGNFRVRLAPSDGPNGRPLALDGIIWDRFDPVVLGVPPGWTVHGVRNKKVPTEWLDCKAMLLLPMIQMAEVLPAGCRLAKLTLEFLPRDAQQSYTPESFEWVVPEGYWDRGVRPAEQPAQKLLLRMASEAEAALGEPIAPGAVGVVLALLDPSGATTQPTGSLRIWVCPATAEQTAPPTEGFRSVPGVAPPVLLGRRILPAEAPAATARFEYVARLSLEGNRLRAALRDGSNGPLPTPNRVWIRVQFVPVDTSQPTLTQTLAISLDATPR